MRRLAAKFSVDLDRFKALFYKLTTDENVRHPDPCRNHCGRGHIGGVSGLPAERLSRHSIGVEKISIPKRCMTLNNRKRLLPSSRLLPAASETHKFATICLCA
jgi:hypothetical protein